MSSTLSFTSPSLFLFPLFTTPFPLSSNLFSCPVITPLFPPVPGIHLILMRIRILDSHWKKWIKSRRNFFFFFAYFYAKTLVISLFSTDLGFESGFMLVFWTLNLDLRLRIFLRIRIQDALMLRIQRIRIRITASPLSRSPVPLPFFPLPQFSFLLLPSHILLSLPSSLPNTSFPVSQSALFLPPPYPQVLLSLKVVNFANLQTLCAKSFALISIPYFAILAQGYLRKGGGGRISKFPLWWIFLGFCFVFCIIWFVFVFFAFRAQHFLNV